MTLKKQWGTVKDNWLLIVLALVLLAAVNFGGVSNLGLKSFNTMGQSDMDYAESYARGGASAPSMTIMPPYYGNDDFAPDVVKRIVTKSASLSTEVERGDFMAAEQRLKGILASANTILLSENVQKQDTERRQYLQGWYQIKVDVKDYDSVVAQLKTLGEVQSFTENSDDITGQYTSVADQLATERTRLARYQQMYSEATRVEDKININDRIFNQEMQIKYLEDQLANLGQRVEYSSISLTLTEERSEYADIAITTLSQLVRDLVQSVNNILSLLFVIVPWVILAAIGWLIWKKVRR